LIFEIRKVYVVEAPLGLVFEQPTISGLVKAVDALRQGDLGIPYESAPPTSADRLAVPGSAAQKKIAAPLEYGQDYESLLEKLELSYEAPPSDFDQRPVTVFLTGATGFLGAFVMQDLLSKKERVKKVICLVRGESVEQSLARLKEGATDRGVWEDDWVESGRLEVVVGDLGLELFGLGTEGWNTLANEADVVLHNGALVSKPFRFPSSVH